jgi:uncharacterized protein (TIGR02217 family)
MAFHSVIFPTTLKVGTKSGRLWEVDVVESLSGAEQRNLYHANGRRVFTIEKGNVTEAQKDELMAFWNARQGRTHSFYYQEGPTTEFESTDSSYELIPVRFNMDRLEPEAVAPDVFSISGIELIEVIGEET